MSKKSFIDEIKVKSPCSQDWATMRGNDTVRFCDHCAKDVNNLSAMTRTRAMKVVRRAGGNLCVRYRTDPKTGGPLFAGRIAHLGRQTGAAAGVLGASVLFAAASYAQGEVVTPVQIERLAKTGVNDARVSGTVMDAHGAVVPFAVIFLTNQETGETFVQNATEEGKYDFKQLPAGKYKLKVEAAGFDVKEITDIQISEGSEVRRDTQMEVQQVAEVVQVGGEMIFTETTVGVVAFTEYSVKSNQLVQAVLRDDFDEVKELVTKRPKVNVRDKSEDGISPLHAAVQNGNLEIATFLLSYGAKVNARDSLKRTPVMMLDEDASVEMLQLLLSHGAKLDQRDKRRNNVLHHLVLNGASVEIFQQVLSSGLDVNAANKKGQTPLMIAAEHNEEDLAILLLGFGADPNFRDREKRSAIELTDNESIKTQLVAYGAIGR